MMDMNEEKVEALIRLCYFTKCLKCEVSGKSCDICCPTQYMADNIEKIIKALEFILKEEGFIDENGNFYE